MKSLVNYVNTVNIHYRLVQVLVKICVFITTYINTFISTFNFIK